MTELLTAGQMRAIELAAIGRGEVTGLELMERAGKGVVEAIFEEWPELEGRGGAAPLDPPEYLDKEEGAALRAVVLCGPGNNGGDGFVVARLLKARGWVVEVFLYGEVEKLPPDAKVNCERWLEMGEVSVWSSDAICTQSADIWFDAVFGAGLTRPPGREILQPLCEVFNSATACKRRVSVDAPTGLCMDSGRALSEEFGAVKATLTVTFQNPRPGHFLGQGRLYCQRVKVVDIGLADMVTRWRQQLQRDPPLPDTDKVEPVHLIFTAYPGNKNFGQNKYHHGHALVLSGPSGRGGAARLAARGALRIGAGLVTVGSPTGAIPEHAAQLDAIMLCPVDGAKALAAALEDARINSLCLGPGLGLTGATREMVEVALEAKRRLVLDADALSIYQNNEEALFALCHEDVVLTPHAGEFGRLFPDSAEKLNAPAIRGPAYSKVDATREAAARAGCVVLFKGADTVIAAPDGACSIHSAHYDRAAPWLATAGSGDVLAGFIAGLMARGFPPMQAAESAAWLHVECARSFGPGLIAEDLPEELPKVFRALVPH